MNITVPEADLVKLRASCRNIGYNLPTIPGDIEQMPWADLHSVRSGHMKAARKILDTMSGDDNEADTLRSGQNHDTAMAVYDAVQDEIEVRAAHDTKEPLTWAQRGRPGSDDAETSAVDGEPVIKRGEWRDAEGRAVQVLSPTENLSRMRHSGPGIGDCLRAMLYGPQNEAERRALAEGTDSAGGFTVPEPLAQEFIDNLRADAVVFRAGARTVNMTSETLSIAKLATDPTTSWTAENGAISPNDPTFGRVTLTAHKLTSLVKVSRELLEDSVNVGEILDNAFRQSVALELDRACLFGSGTSPEPRGLVNVSGVNAVSMATNGAAPTNYDKLIDAVYEIQSNNGGEPTAMIWNPRTGMTLAKLKDADANPMSVPTMVADIPKLSTTAVPIDETQGTDTASSSVITGDFRQMLVGFRSAIRILRTDQLYLENDQIGFLAMLRADIALTQPKSFTRLAGVKA